MLTRLLAPSGLERIEVANGKVPLQARGGEDVCENSCFLAVVSRKTLKFVKIVNQSCKFMKIYWIYERFHNLFEKGAKREPKGIKREPKGAKSEPKGSQGEPKVSHLEFQ